ncbi:MAG: branched-chain amino acid ABC transporter permease [Gammaproteobacteria bacterium]|nr:branched-chain amino acid ABC transporter permease [Gammaproteobacteria bacterium]
MDIFIQQLANGLIIGSIYALIALGYTMVYGILGLINFAHGDVVMVGAMTTVTILTTLIGFNLGIPPYLLLVIAVLLALPVCALLGFSIERIAYRPLRHAPRLAPLITGIGVSIMLQNLAMMVWGRGYQRFPDVLTSTPFTIFTARITAYQMGTFVLSIVLMLGLWILVQRTRLGRAMRATSQNDKVAALMGVNVNRIISSVFMLGSGLGCVAGVMYTASYGQASATMGFLLGLKAFSAAVLGGIGNIRGAVLGGFVLGVIEAMGAGYLSDWTHGLMGSEYKDIFAFLVLIAVLMVRPSGLLGERQSERA